MLSHHAPDEQDYWSETVEIETVDGEKVKVKTSLLRVYPSGFNGYDAYMDIPKNTPHDPYKFKKVYFPKLDIHWEVITTPTESGIKGDFRGNHTPTSNIPGNTPAWIFGLRNCSN
ncbi:hypothetical protein [Oscillatoria acuminata]|uniref:Uncharacterized protein n=1 Tax=Oscillatoria acuminata PCC 6304 TaxID=56110 RepID=K9TDY5_9CYAN|nr:hypothetical protein [Oscillatoria acuminata]AFY80740.1 hypothetical protein Oscil6304_1011 [Oscillatoria acuminata PCC 6304]